MHEHCPYYLIYLSNNTSNFEENMFIGENDTFKACLSQERSKTLPKQRVYYIPSIDLIIMLHVSLQPFGIPLLYVPALSVPCLGPSFCV